VKLKDLASYLIVPARADAPEHYLIEMKRLEWIFIAVRWLWVPIIFILARLHHPAQMTTMMVLGGVIGLCNACACVLNVKLKTQGTQKALGITMLVFDTLLAWGVILLFVRDFYTAAYAGFVYIIIEAAIRFGLGGSLGMALVFVVGLYGAYMYRSAAFGVRFSVSGYVFWTVLMAIVAVAVGAIVNEGKRQRALSERRLHENTLLAERHRLARELHDTVLKTLQGLSLEARALGNRTATTRPSVKETAQYIEEVCSRTSREIREVIFDLRSDSSVDGIGSQVSRLLDDWRRATGIAGESTLTGSDIILPAELSRQLRNIVSEALTNIQRHASASLVKIVVKIFAGELNIKISDNGHGIGSGIGELDTFVTEGKLGIAGMKERAELLGGRFSLISDPSGTRVGLNIPLPITPKERVDDGPD
jgi:signal transduction histidine kinase